MMTDSGELGLTKQGVVFLTNDKLPRLERLNISLNNLQDEGLVALCGQISNLVELNIGIGQT